MSATISAKAAVSGVGRKQQPVIDCYLELPDDVLKCMGNKKRIVILAIREFGGRQIATVRPGRKRGKNRQNSSKTLKPQKQAKAAKPAKPAKAAKTKPAKASKPARPNLSAKDRKYIAAEHDNQKNSTFTAKTSFDASQIVGSTEQRKMLVHNSRFVAPVPYKISSKDTF